MYPGPLAHRKIVGDEGGWLGRFRCSLGLHSWMRYMGSVVCQRCLRHKPEQGDGR